MGRRSSQALASLRNFRRRLPVHGPVLPKGMRWVALTAWHQIGQFSY